MMSFPHPSDARRRFASRLAAAAAVACALSLACSGTPAADGSPRPVQPAPDVSSPAAEPDGSAATMPPDEPGPAAAPERRWQVFSGDLRLLDISSIPGPARPRPRLIADGEPERRARTWTAGLSDEARSNARGRDGGICGELRGAERRGHTSATPGRRGAPGVAGMEG